MLRHGMARGTTAAIRKARFMHVFTCIHETHVCMHVKNGGRSTPIRLGGVISTMLSSDLALVHFCCSPTRRAHPRITTLQTCFFTHADPNAIRKIKCFRDDTIRSFVDPILCFSHQYIAFPCGDCLGILHINDLIQRIVKPK